MFWFAVKAKVLKQASSWNRTGRWSDAAEELRCQILSHEPYPGVVAKTLYWSIFDPVSLRQDFIRLLYSKAQINAPIDRKDYCILWPIWIRLTELVRTKRKMFWTDSIRFADLLFSRSSPLQTNVICVGVTSRRKIKALTINMTMVDIQVSRSMCSMRTYLQNIARSFLIKQQECQQVSPRCSFSALHVKEFSRVHKHQANKWQWSFDKKWDATNAISPKSSNPKSCFIERRGIVFSLFSSSFSNSKLNTCALFYGKSFWLDEFLICSWNRQRIW